VPLRDLPPAHGPGRAFALVLGKRIAIRRLVALKDDGRREVIDRRRGPGAARCGEGGSLLFVFGDYEVATPRGPVALTVYDDGPLLCATLGRVTRHPGECRHPPLDPYESWILTRPSGHTRLVAGVVPHEVARAVVKLEGGARIAVDTSAEAFYGGQYSGRVRFFTLELPRRQRMRAIRLLDSAGNGLSTIPSEDQFRPAGPARVVLRGPHGLRLSARRFGSRDITHGYLCIRLGRGTCGSPFAGDVGVRAHCDPRGLVLWGTLPRAASAVTVETDHGDVAATVSRLPRALRDRPKSKPHFFRELAASSVFMAVLPPRMSPTGVRLGGRSSLHRRVQLPPASAQCGYDDILSLFF
jgi:hypothetical protein